MNEEFLAHQVGLLYLLIQMKGMGPLSRTTKGAAVASQPWPERFEVDARGRRAYGFAQKCS
jgi:hypothetical protein